MASAVNDAAREVGGALGIAVLGSVLADHVDHVDHLGPGMNPRSFVDGFSAAVLVAAAVLAAGGLFLALRAPGRKEAVEERGGRAPAWVVDSRTAAGGGGGGMGPLAAWRRGKG